MGEPLSPEDLEFMRAYLIDEKQTTEASTDAGDPVIETAAFEPSSSSAVPAALYNLNQSFNVTRSGAGATANANGRITGGINLVDANWKASWTTKRTGGKSLSKITSSVKADAFGAVAAWPFVGKIYSKCHVREWRKQLVLLSEWPSDRSGGVHADRLPVIRLHELRLIQLAVRSRNHGRIACQLAGSYHQCACRRHHSGDRVRDRAGHCSFHSATHAPPGRNACSRRTLIETYSHQSQGVSKEFREDVVRVAQNREPDVTLAQIERYFGVHVGTLDKWLREARIDDGEQPGMTRSESNELRELRKRNRLLEQENEVLRRAAAYLSQANLPGKGSTRS